LLGARIIACCGTKAKDEEIFDALLKSMMKTELVLVILEPPIAIVATQDLDAMIVVPQKFAWNSKYYK